MDTSNESCLLSFPASVPPVQIPCKHIFSYPVSDKMRLESNECYLCGSPIVDVQMLRAGKDKIFIDSVTMKSFLRKEDLISFKLQCMSESQVGKDA